MNNIAAQRPTLSATSAMSQPRGTCETSPIATLLRDSAQTRDSAVPVLRLFASIESPLLTTANAPPAAAICARTPSGSPGLTADCVRERTAHPANAESTQSDLLNSVPYHFGPPRKSRSSNVPMNATQHTPNGLSRPGSKSAARTGAVVIVAWTPPGSRTGSAAATNVTTIQKKIRPRSSSAGGGAETRTRISAATATTGTNSHRTEGGTGGSRDVTAGGYARQPSKPHLTGYIRKQKKGLTALPLRAFTRL